jgi:hypothetical protein
MTNLYSYVDDCDNIHWILWDPDSRDNSGRALLEDAMRTDFPITTCLENRNNETLEDLGNFLFCKYHDDDDDYRKFLLREFEGDMNAFVRFLADNLSEEDLNDLKCRLANRLTKETIVV